MSSGWLGVLILRCKASNRNAVKIPRAALWSEFARFWIGMRARTTAI
jgi:hypothetical protein